MPAGKITFTELIQQYPGYAVAVAGLIVLAIWFGRIYWRNRLTKWAEGQGMKLVSFRSAWFYEGPHKFVRSKHQHLFRVIVEDRVGITHSAWVLFGTFWGFTWGSPLTEVRWDNETDY